MSKRLTQEFIEKEFNKRGYTVTSPYINCFTKIDCICSNNHSCAITWANFQTGKGCIICGVNKRSHSTKYVKSFFEKENYILHDEYKNAYTKLNYTCSENHSHSMTWNSFQKGHRCPSCSDSGFKPNEPTIVYYVAFDLLHTTIYKIGITRNSVKKRFREESIPYRLLHERYFLTGRLAYEYEQNLIKRFSKFQYTGKILKNGNTECFTEDILKLDKV